MKRITHIIAALSIFATGAIVAWAAADDTVRPQAFAATNCTTGLVRTNNSGGSPLSLPCIPNTPCWRAGSQTYRPADVTFAACTAPTPTTTAAPTTTGAPSTTTLAPTTTSTTIPTTSTTTTSSTIPATTTVAPTTTLPSSGDFVETFTGNTGFERFVHGVHHRDSATASGTFPGDHDLNCGTPATQRVVHASVKDESFWTCADHLMTGMGDVSAYSVVWFEPNQTFSSADTDTVSWDVNVTDLGARKWWEVMIVPTSFNSGFTDCPHCAVADWLSPSPSNLPAYPSTATVLGSGPFGNDGGAFSGGQARPLLDWQHICGDWAVDPEGCASKMIRRPFTIHDNRNGTITFSFLGDTYTYSGAFPSQFRVVFKDHSYTPTKDGTPQGFTWHWDGIVIR